MRVRLNRMGGPLIAALTLSGCVANTDAPGLPSAADILAAVQRVDAVAATVPAETRTSGRLVVGVNLPSPPNEFRDPTGRIVGFDVDLMDAIAATLGLAAEYREADFEKIIPAVRGGSYDVGASSFTDTEERERVVDFVTYFSAGTMWAQRAGGTVEPDNACGLTVSVQSLTIADTHELPARSAACAAAGRPPIEVVRFDRQDVATNALLLGRVDAMTADYPTVMWAISQTAGRLQTAGDMVQDAPYGWAVAKDAPLARSLLGALRHLIDTGVYRAIAAVWGVEAGMIDSPEINGAHSRGRYR